MDQKDKELEQYIENFIQRRPRYAVKQIGKKPWKTKNKPLSDKPIKAHLNGQYYVGVLGKWYPGFAVLDIDGKEKDSAEEIRENFKLSTDNSMFVTSESENSYHILFKPSYNNRPPTIRLLNEIMKPFANEKGIEIYPQANKPIRLPFGLNQKMLDFEFVGLDRWQEKLFWFTKLNDFDLKEIPNQQLSLDLSVKPDSGYNVSTYEEGKFLYQNGLVEKHSRHDSQFKVLYYIWRHNVPINNAIEMTWYWIKNKHNNNSEQILTNPQSVKKEIIRQANHTYTKYDLERIYPDEIHNVYKGYLTKSDIEKILHISKSGLPMAKFLFNLIKYSYPRRHNVFIKIHSNFLREWSRRGYQEYIDALQELGIVKRYGSYRVDSYSKSMTVNWNFRDTSLAILTDHRAPETFEETIMASYGPEEFKELLIEAGSKRDTAIKTIKRIFGGVTNVPTYYNSY